MRTIRTITISALVLATLAPAALAQRPEATTHRVFTAGNRYIPGDTSVVPLPPVVIFEGDSLSHTNVDTERHDLMALATGPNGAPVFDSPLIGPGETAAVPVEGLDAGVYAFTCSIHPFMSGSLEVKVNPVGEPAEEEPYAVSSGDNFFQPKTLTVPIGARVRWTNNGQINHTVTAADGSWDSSPACPATNQCWGPGQTYERTFTQAGSVPYYCKLHGTPSGNGHAGTIVVVDPASLPTTVTTLSASAGPNAIGVSGGATFGGEQPKLAGEDVTGDSPGGGQTAQFGVDLEKVSLHQPDPNKPELQFIWKVTQLDAAPPPEVVRYLWQMKLNGKEYWVQAKTTDFLSGTNVTDDPAGHAQHLQGAFKLRGNCGPIVGQVPNVTTCRHVMWLEGTFDPAKDEVRLRMPLGNAAAPEFAPGVVVTPFGTAGAGFQVGISNGSTEDQVAWDTPYTIPSKGVSLGIAPAGTPVEQVSFSATATLSPDGSFSGSLSRAGLAAGAYDVWAKGCFADNCGTRKATITF